MQKVRIGIPGYADDCLGTACGTKSVVVVASDGVNVYVSVSVCDLQRMYLLS